MIDIAVAACAVAITCGFLFTRATRWLALRVGLVDRPDGHRKLHADSVPLGGGVAVLLATAAAVAFVVFLPYEWNLHTPKQWLDLVCFTVACNGIVLLGLIDDRFGIRGRYKLLGQLLCVLALIPCGLTIERIGLFGCHLDLGPLALPFTLFWMLGAINAINLLDGIDGLATTLGVILSLTLAALAWLAGHHAVGMVALLFASALLGFLPMNFPPARMYLGDAGSMLIGLMVGALAIRASLKGPGTVLLAAPLAVWTIPVFDSAAAVLRRKLTGRSIYATDRAHLHHQMFNALGSNLRVIACVAVACAITSTAALASQAYKKDVIALGSVVGVVGVFVATGLFGRAEWRLLINRLRRLGAEWPGRGDSPAESFHVSTVRLQGSRQWELIWETLVESADKLGLDKVRLDLNLPAMQEGYNARWERTRAIDDQRQWRIDLPLVVDSHTVGSLSVVGRRDGASALEAIGQILDILEPFEVQLMHFARHADLPLDERAPDAAAATSAAAASPAPDESTRSATAP
jgi:UDP-GlcNAc:undecaprenyl-phosphate GlcNAc-1-phosphate transferase